MNEGVLSGRHDLALRSGVQIEVVTVAWMVIEAAVAIGAGILARSMLLTAFGVDSVIELVSGGVLLWRLAKEAQGASLERVERTGNRAAWVAGIGLILLCMYVVVTSIAGLLGHNQAERSPVASASRSPRSLSC